MSLPLYISILLCILKTFYYKIPILSKSIYINTKNRILDSINDPNMNIKFIVLDEQ